MNGQSGNSRVTVSKDVLFLPASAKTVPQEEIDALEAKRIRRLRELGDWRPSSGWQIEPNLRSEDTLPAVNAQEATLPGENVGRNQDVRAVKLPRSTGTVVRLRMSGARQSLHGE